MYIPLGLLQRGEKGEIVEVANPGGGRGFGWGRGFGGGRGVFQRLAGLGLYKGQIVEVINNPGWGPVLIKFNETTVAIGRGVAMKILVRKL